MSNLCRTIQCYVCNNFYQLAISLCVDYHYQRIIAKLIKFLLVINFVLLSFKLYQSNHKKRRRIENHDL